MEIIQLKTNTRADLNKISLFAKMGQFFFSLSQFENYTMSYFKSVLHESSPSSFIDTRHKHNIFRTYIRCPL